MPTQFREIDPTPGTHNRRCPECEGTRLKISYVNGRFNLIQEDGKPDEVEILTGDKEEVECLKCDFASMDITDFVIEK